MICEKCKKEFSNEYKSCPHCGYRQVEGEATQNAIFASRNYVQTRAGGGKSLTYGILSLVFFTVCAPMTLMIDVMLFIGDLVFCAIAVVLIVLTIVFGGKAIERSEDGIMENGQQTGTAKVGKKLGTLGRIFGWIAVAHCILRVVLWVWEI